ncbi:hypothetical protein Scep_020907 [Stephania cephalantha]|uniref:Uncharacterized protein n=1 Tax=Stephania cephalantha TaxID=152367 RepID=A0AAP0F9S2_9MAGN
MRAPAREQRRQRTARTDGGRRRGSEEDDQQRDDFDEDFNDSIAIEHLVATLVPFGMFSRATAQVSRQCRTDLVRLKRTWSVGLYR